MKKILLVALFSIGSAMGISAQGYYNLNFTNAPGNPGGINTDFDFALPAFSPPSGTTKILGYSKTSAYSSQQTLPFAFKFNGVSVSNFYANTAGYLSFSKIALTKNAGFSPVALPSALLPDSTICAWGVTTRPLAQGVAEVYTKTYGTAPHRQFWVCWFAASNPSDTCSFNVWSIALEESTNNIYVVDAGAPFFWTQVCNTYTSFGLTVGIQVDPTHVYQVAGSPNVQTSKTNGNGSNSFNDYYEFCPDPNPSYAAQVVSSNTNLYYAVGKSYPVSALIANVGSSALTSLTFNWSVDGGTPHSNATPISIAAPNPVSTATGTSTTNWTPLTAGTHTMKIWATQLNGSNVNGDVNDTLYLNKLTVLDSIMPKTVMFEETSCASCNPCMYAMPNIDSVAANVLPYCNTVRYHWYFPGQDMINQVTATLVNTRFETYYGQNGVPDGALDGAIIAPSPNQGNPWFSTPIVQQEQAQGSPFRISITSASYTASSKTFALNATIKSYGTFPAGLTVQVVLTEDYVDFHTDQSTEDPVSSFAPPIGTTAGGNDDSYYPLVLNFPDAVENMLPSVNGTSMNAFTPGSSQTISVSWVKNHPWAAKYKSYPYDSSGTQHLTVFIQDDKGISGVPAHYVFQSARVQVGKAITGVEEMSVDAVSFKMYPNPTNGNTTLAFNLDQDQNVTVQVYNMLGEVVYSNNEGTLTTGQHTLMINGSAMNNGVYLVKLTTNSGVSVQRLVIQK